MDGGKPIKESRDVDLPLVAAHFFYYAGWADKLEYAFPGLDPEPLGVAGQVIPWNFPLMMLAWKVAPALAAGNTVVLKPAETTPLTALIFAAAGRRGRASTRCVQRGDRRRGDGLAPRRPPDVDKVAFTGSTAVGKLIQPQPRRDQQEADPGARWQGAPMSYSTTLRSTRRSRESSTASSSTRATSAVPGSRLFVQESIHDRFVDKLKRRLSTLRVGDPLDKNTDIGAINSSEQLDKISELVESGRAEGAEIFQPDCVLPRQRLLVQTDVVHRRVARATGSPRRRSSGRCCRSSPSGPPRKRSRRRTTRPTGLSAGVWTTKGSRILWMADRLQAGVVWANTYNKFDPASPFGGYKESGFGREGGRHGLLAYLKGDGDEAR